MKTSIRLQVHRREVLVSGHTAEEVLNAVDLICQEYKGSLNTSRSDPKMTTGDYPFCAVIVAGSRLADFDPAFADAVIVVATRNSWDYNSYHA